MATATLGETLSQLTAGITGGWLEGEDLLLGYVLSYELHFDLCVVQSMSASIAQTQTPALRFMHSKRPLPKPRI
jgi:hypothetical protein